jgi:hypothetical protein
MAARFNVFCDTARRKKDAADPRLNKILRGSGGNAGQVAGSLSRRYQYAPFRPANAAGAIA